MESPLKSSKKRIGLAIATAVLAGTFTLVGVEAADAAYPGSPTCTPHTQTVTFPGLNEEWVYTGAWYSAGHAGYTYDYFTLAGGSGWTYRGQVLCTLS